MSDLVQTDPADAFDQEVKAAFDDQLVHANDPNWHNEIYENEVIVYRVSGALAERMLRYGCVPDPLKCNTCVLPPEYGRVLYMDVGRWGGSAPTPSDTPVQWGRRRCFGVICGEVAALCDYPDPVAQYSQPHDAGVDPAIKKTRDYQLIEPLLNYLAVGDLRRGISIGRMVTKALHAEMKIPHQKNPPQNEVEVPRRDVIHVFLGDLHVPVMDGHDPTRTMFGDAYKPPRRGRVDAEQLAAMTALGQSSGVITPGGAMGTAAAAYGFVHDEKLKRWSKKDVLKTTSATQWLQSYCGDPIAAKAKRGRGADIFDGAGADLEKWLDLLIAYNGRANVAEGRPPVRLVQLGDLFDFWIGLQRLTDGNVFKVKKKLARKFINFWINETLSTKERSAINKLLTLSQAGVPTEFVRGNHDNYMFLSGHRSEYWEQGFFSEHGHAIDQYNRDESHLMGWALTQLAYMVPDVRYIESPLKGYMSMIMSGVAPRLEMYDRAVDKCLTERLPTPIVSGTRQLLTYVQAHTHTPDLRLLSLQWRR